MGISKSLTFQYQGISSVLALIAQMVCIASIDKIGRRWAMIGGNLANCLFFTIATIMLAVFPPATNSNASASWAFIVVTWLYNISFSATNGPLSWIVPAEIFDTRTRYSGASIAYQVGGMIGGALTPIVATSLYETFRSSDPIALWVGLLCAASLIAVLVLRAPVTTSGSVAAVERACMLVWW